MRLRDTCKSIPAREITLGMKLYGSDVVAIDTDDPIGDVTVYVATRDGSTYEFSSSEYVWIKE